MRLSCIATTPQELREEIVKLLLHRSAQQAALVNLTTRKTLKETHEYTALALINLAGDINEMELTDASPADDPLASDGSTRVLDAATKGREEWKD
jgi:hypothetical protein